MHPLTLLSLLALTICLSLPVNGKKGSAKSMRDLLVALGIQPGGTNRIRPVPGYVTRQACSSSTTITRRSGDIVAPGLWGRGYQKNTKCEWIIRTRPSRRFKLIILMTDVDCDGDEYLGVWDTGASTELTSTKVCNDRTPVFIPIFSYTNQVTIRFIAPSKGHSRFIIRFKTIAAPECGAQFVRPLYTLAHMTAPTVVPTTTPAGPLPDNPIVGIVGGKEAAPHSWPWMVTLTYYTMHMCGAVILNERWVITAAHCIDSLWAEEDLTVEVGRHQGAWETDEKPKLVQLIPIKKFIINSKYNGQTYENDIALIELNGTISYNEHVQPICLSHSNPRPGKKCVIAGWGVTQGTASESVLNQAVVPIVAQSVCKKPDWYGDRVFDVQFCAGYEQGIVDSCTGDSGGPLMCPTYRGTWELMGLTSWGDDCGLAKKPGVYTRVVKFLKWIRKHSRGEIQT